MTFQFPFKVYGRRAFAATAMTGLLGTFLVPLTASSQSAKQSSDFVGTWVLTAADKLLPDGSRVSDYGENPHGLAIFTSDGHYSLQIYRAERVKFSSGDKFTGTAGEYRDVSLGMSTGFGRYSFDTAKGTVTFHVDRSSVPNLDDTTRVLAFELKGDILSWKVPARKDGSIPITVLRRAN
jgi:Lipocalin-like domain